MARKSIKRLSRGPLRDDEMYSSAVRWHDRLGIKCILDKGWRDEAVINRCFADAADASLCKLCDESSALAFLEWLKEVSGANVNGVDAHGRTALWYVCRNNEIDVVEWLIKQGADVNCADKNGDSALMVAIARGNTEIARMLIKSGADTGHKNKNGLTPLDYALVKMDRIAWHNEQVSWMLPKAFFDKLKG